MRSEDIKEMKLVYDRPASLVDRPTHYCPGCGHGIVHKLLAQLIDDLKIRDETILLAIGTAETVHAANRGEKISVIFINNAIYGMTGGQMAPTSLANQKTKTSPYGRDPEDIGLPIRACEMLNTLEAPVFIERCAVNNVKNVLKTKRAIKKVLENQISGKGYSFVEILSMCPTGWGMQTPEAAEWVEKAMIPYYPLGNFRDR